jgi:hypothetical protein
MLLLGPLTIACLLTVPSPTPLATPTLLKGNIRFVPSLGDSVRVTYRNEKESRTAVAAVGLNGDFQLVLPDVAIPVFARMGYGRQYTTLYLTPGDELTVALDFPRFEQTLRYAGRGAAANNYLARAFYAFESTASDHPARPQEPVTAATTAAQMRRAADAFRQARHAFLATYAAGHPLTADFRRDAAAHIDLQWALSLLEYPPRYEQLAQRAPELPATYYDFLPQLPPHTLDPPLAIRDRGAMDNTLVFMCLRAYAHRLLPAGTLGTNPQEAERLYQTATAELRPVEARDEAMFMLILGQIATNLPGALAAYPAFRTHNRDSVRGRDLRRALAQQQIVSAGREAPEVTLPDHVGKTVSLREFKGKVLYLDFWGTWCAPCLAEMPASTRLKQRFAGRAWSSFTLPSGTRKPNGKRCSPPRNSPAPIVCTCGARTIAFRPRTTFRATRLTC